MNTEPVVSVRGVKKMYPLGKTEVWALRGIDFDLSRGDFISIAGPSGSGKTTLLNLLGCLDTPTEGEVFLEGVSTRSLGDDQITDLRHQVIGFIFQSFNLIPVLSVRENVEFPLLIGTGRRPAPDQQWIDHLIEAVGLSDWRLHRPNELSGGQRQRVAIARSLVNRPRIVMADEPTANLDSKTGEAIIDLMKRISHELGTTFIFSTHDQRIVDVADHVIRILDGVVVENSLVPGFVR
ncbi:MAG: ABC transporter ATP-binding protein [Spirochaetales bacterium]